MCTNRGIDKDVYMHVMEYYSAIVYMYMRDIYTMECIYVGHIYSGIISILKKEIMPFAATGVDLKTHSE